MFNQQKHLRGATISRAAERIIDIQNKDEIALGQATGDLPEVMFLRPKPAHTPLSPGSVTIHIGSINSSGGINITGNNYSKPADRYEPSVAVIHDVKEEPEVKTGCW